MTMTKGAQKVPLLVALTKGQQEKFLKDLIMNCVLFNNQRHNMYQKLNAMKTILISPCRSAYSRKKGFRDAIRSTIWPSFQL
jgi:hypothetical protein